MSTRIATRRRGERIKKRLRGTMNIDVFRLSVASLKRKSELRMRPVWPEESQQCFACAFSAEQPRLPKALRRERGRGVALPVRWKILSKVPSFDRGPAAWVTRLRQEHRRIFLIIQPGRNLPIGELFDLESFEPFVGYAVEVSKGAPGEVLDIGGGREHSGPFHFGG